MFKNIKPSNVASLSFNKYAHFDKYSKGIDSTTEYIIKAASVIPDDQYFGWQVSISRDKSLASVIFTTSKVDVTIDDYNWMFKEWADVSGPLDDYNDEFYAEGRKIYRIVAKQKDDVDDDDYVYGLDHMYCNRDNLMKMLEMMQDIGVLLRVVVSKNRGAILVSAEQDITLRMRTIISLAFKHGRIVGEQDIKDSKDSENNEGSLTVKDLESVFPSIMFSVMKLKYVMERTDEETNSFTPIEELKLGIRSYNCLKRAGVHSIEQLLQMEEKDYYSVRNLSKRSYEEILDKLEDYLKNKPEKVENSVPDKTGKSYMEMLDELIGLEDVKNKVREIVAYAHMKKDMAEKGKELIPIALNMAFVGNPGTAKTTVARILAGIFYEIGLLSSDEIVEVGRPDFTGKYAGETEGKTKALFKNSKGKMMFIDEAYSLVDYWNGADGDMAINVIVQEMENNRDDIIVVFAGYPDKMKEFIDRNPGMRSRIPFTIRFDDYSAADMVQIAEYEAGRRGFEVDCQARDKLMSICETAAGRSDAGNGRFCRNIVEKAIVSYALRVYGNEGKAQGNDFKFLEEDFSLPVVADKKAEHKVTMGFCS